MARGHVIQALKFLKWKSEIYIIRIPSLRYLVEMGYLPLRGLWAKLLYHFGNVYLDDSKYDILLIHPKSDTDRSIFIPPHSLLSVAAPLTKHGYKVKIIDQRIERNCFKHIAAILKKGIICVGVTFYTGSQIKHACELIDYIKGRYPLVKVVVGGPHATILSHQTVQYKNIDIVVVGEGEKTFLNLVKAIEKNANLNNIHGIIFKEDNKIIQTPPQEPVDLNEYYTIPRSLIKNHIIYQVGSLFTSRGCTARCAYCAIPVLYPMRRTLKSELVIEQIKEILKFGEREIYFLDDNFFADTKRVEEILDSIIDEKLTFTWWAESRIDYVLQWEDDFLVKLRRCGLVRLYLGAESGSDRILKMINKNIEVEMIKNAGRRLKRFGIIPEFTFMVGFPTETQSEMEKTKDLIREIKRDIPSSIMWKLNTYTPYPGTKLFDLLLRGGFAPPGSLREWAKIHWYRKEYNLMYEKELL